MDSIANEPRPYLPFIQICKTDKSAIYAENLCLSFKATFTSPINTGTSTKGPITAAKAAPELIPKTDIATAIASSKLLLAAVKERVAVLA